MRNHANVLESKVSFWDFPCLAFFDGGKEKMLLASSFDITLSPHGEGLWIKTPASSSFPFQFFYRSPVWILKISAYRNEIATSHANDDDDVTENQKYPPIPSEKESSSKELYVHDTIIINNFVAECENVCKRP